MARLVFLRLPSPVRVRRVLPCRLIVLTEVTFTPNTFSTAILISVLLASGCTGTCTCWRRAGRSSSPTPPARAGCRGGPCEACSLVVLLLPAGAGEPGSLGVVGGLEVELRDRLVVGPAVGLVVETGVGVALDLVALRGTA